MTKNRHERSEADPTALWLAWCDLKLQPNKGHSCRLSSMFGQGDHLFFLIWINSSLNPSNDTLKQIDVDIPQAS